MICYVIVVRHSPDSPIVAALANEFHGDVRFAETLPIRLSHPDLRASAVSFSSGMNGIPFDTLSSIS